MAIRIDGKALAAKIKSRTAEEAAKLGRKPSLAVVLAGDDPASQVYVAGKERDCTECGISSITHRLPADVSQTQLTELVEGLNKEPEVDGILVQLPLPKHLQWKADMIHPDKDVDCFHPYNIGRLSIGTPVFLPCTPAGIMEMLKAYEITVRGKRCVVLGRSNIVGKPMAMLLAQQDGTVTLCHSRTEQVEAYTKDADIIVSAVGKVRSLTAEMIKEGAVVIDVAMNRDETGKLCGDADFVAVEKKAAYITPVPGGVGPMTRAMLMRNILVAAKNHARQ